MFDLPAYMCGMNVYGNRNRDDITIIIRKLYIDMSKGCKIYHDITCMGIQRGRRFPLVIFVPLIKLAISVS